MNMMAANFEISKPKKRKITEIRDFCQGQFVFPNGGETSKTAFHQCRYCKRVLGTEQGLESHYNSFHKEIACALCPGLVCPNKSEWRQHMARAHSDMLVVSADVFPCDICNRVLTSEVNRTAHKRSFHELVPCSICGMEVKGMNRLRHMLKYHLEVPENGDMLMAKKESKKQKLMECEMKKLEQKAIKKWRNEEKLKLKAQQRRERLERALLKENLAAFGIGAPITSPSDYGVNLKKNVVAVPMHFPISEVWYSPAFPNEVPLAALDDCSLAFDPNDYRQLSDGSDTFAADNVNSVQLEFVDEVEVMEEKHAKKVMFENNLMFWSGEISVVAEEIVVENLPENVMEKGPGKLITRKCSCCGQNFFLDLDFHLHNCGPTSYQDEEGRALVLPIEQELHCWEQHINKFEI